MNQYQTPDSKPRQGALSFSTFIKVCFLGVVGSHIVICAAYLLFLFLKTLLSPVKNTAGVESIFSLPLSMLISAGLIYAIASTVITGIITGILGYPFYLWISTVKGGMSHRMRGDNNPNPVNWVIFRSHFILSAKVIPITIIVFVCASVLMSYFRTPIYVSSTSILFNLGKQLEANMADARGDYYDTQQRILQSRHITENAKKKLNTDLGDLDLKLNSISTKRVGRSSVMMITVESTESALSADLANAIVDEFLEFKQSESNSDDITRQIDDNTSIRIIERAQPSPPNSSPGTLIRLVSSIILGLFVGICIALIMAAIRYRNSIIHINMS